MVKRNKRDREKNKMETEQNKPSQLCHNWDKPRTKEELSQQRKRESRDNDVAQK